MIGHIKTIREALAFLDAQFGWSPGEAPAIDALRELTNQEAQQHKTVTNDEQASAFMNAKLWEFIDMAGVWPRAKPDPRIWAHVMVYAPVTQKSQVEPRKADVAHTCPFCNEEWVEQAQAEAVASGYVLVPVKPSRGIEAAIARARNLKASEIWEWAIDAAIAQQKGKDNG